MQTTGCRSYRTHFCEKEVLSTRTQFRCYFISEEGAYLHAGPKINLSENKRFRKRWKWRRVYLSGTPGREKIRVDVEINRVGSMFRSSSKDDLGKSPLCQYKQETEDPRNNEQQDKNAHRFSICIAPPPSTKHRRCGTNTAEIMEWDSIFTFRIS